MKQIITALTLAIVFTFHPLFAEEVTTPPASTAEQQPTSFWDNIRKKIETFTPKKKLTATTAVGGVRGAQIESDDLYWKGEAKPVEIDAAELDSFKNALTLFEAENTKDAILAFEKFVSDYPESKLIADAKEALKQLQN